MKLYKKAPHVRKMFDTSEFVVLQGTSSALAFSLVALLQYKLLPL